MIKNQYTVNAVQVSGIHIYNLKVTIMVRIRHEERVMKQISTIKPNVGRTSATGLSRFALNKRFY